jgi:hypothetical protein
MTVPQVERIMGKYMKGRGSKWGQPESTYPIDSAHATGVMTYRWSNEAQFDSDWGVVRFENGKVVSTDFEPD